MAELREENSWLKFSSYSMRYLKNRQDILVKAYKLGEYERFDWDQETKSLVFTDNGEIKVVAKIQFVGNINTHSSTWEWSWSNPTFITAAKQEMLRVKQYGEAHDYPALTHAQWVADDIDGWKMTSVAAKILEAKGAYKIATKTGYTYMVITDITSANNWK